MGNGKSDINFKVDANTAEFVQKVLQARQAMEGVADTSRKVERDVGGAGVKFSDLSKLSGAAGIDIAKFATGLGVGAAAVTFMADRVTSYIDRMTEARKRTDEFSLSIEKNLAIQGKLALEPQRMAQLTGMGLPLDAKNLQALFNKVQTDVGDNASEERKLAIVKAAGQARRVLADPSQVMDLAGDMSNMQKLYGDSISPEALRDKALSRFQKGRFTPEMFGAAMRVKATGAMDEDSIVGMIDALMDAGQNPKALGSLLDKLQGMKGHAFKRGQVLTGKEELENKLAGMPFADRVKAVLGDPSQINELMQGEAGGFDFGGSKIAAAKAFDPTDNARALKGAVGSEFGNRLRDASQNEFFQQRLIKDTLDAEREQKGLNPNRLDRMLKFSSYEAAIDSATEDQGIGADILGYGAKKLPKIVANNPEVLKTAGTFGQNSLDLGVAGYLSPATVGTQLSGDFARLLGAAGEKLNSAAESLGKSNREGKEGLLDHRMETGRQRGN